MTDKTSTAEREAADCFNTWFMSLPERRQDVFRKDMWLFAYAAYQAGRASLPLPGAQEAVAPLPTVVQEPVAWTMLSENGNIRLWSQKPLPHPDARPLYAAPVPAVPAGWQPIETAPKDGTEIILRRGIRVGAAAWFHWPATEFHEAGAGWSIGFDGDSWDDEKAPTHWLPLPPSPPMDGESNADQA